MTRTRTGTRTTATATATATAQRVRLGTRLRTGAVALLSAVGMALGAPAAPGSAATPPAASPTPGVPLPAAMADTGGGTQLITARARTLGATTGTVKWWQRRNGRWRQLGSAPARFGAAWPGRGPQPGAGHQNHPDRAVRPAVRLRDRAGDRPAPQPPTAGSARTPGGARTTPPPPTTAGWNRCPRTARPTSPSAWPHYPTQYSRALVIGFNYHRPVRGRGAGIFLHVNGKGATAGCVSVPAGTMARILSWVRPSAHPHLAIGTPSGPTAITRY